MLWYDDERKAYEGRWSGGEWHGLGQAWYQDGTHYEGNFHMGMRHGHGRGNFADGGWYEGEWRENQIHGKGAALFADGGAYDGEWARGKPEGMGKMTAPDNAGWMEAARGKRAACTSASPAPTRTQRRMMAEEDGAGAIEKVSSTKPIVT